jgi:hypothetical protein
LELAHVRFSNQPSGGLAERRADIVCGCGGDDFELLSRGRSRRLHVREQGPNLRIAGIDQDRKAYVSVQQLMQKAELLCRQLHIHRGDANRLHDRNGRGRDCGRASRRDAAPGHDDGHRTADQISHQFRQPTACAMPPAVFDRDIAASASPVRNPITNFAFASGGNGVSHVSLQVDHAPRRCERGGVMSESFGLTSHKSSCNCTGCGMLRAGVCINCAEKIAALILESGSRELAVEPCSGACREAIELYFSTPPERWRAPLTPRRP